MLQHSSQIFISNTLYLDYVTSITYIIDALIFVESIDKFYSYSKIIQDYAWLDAIHKEMTSIIANNIYELILLPLKIKLITIR